MKWNPFKWLYKEIKSDIIKIIDMFNNPKSYIFNIKNLASPKYFALFIILAFFCGSLVSAKYFEMKTNKVITDVCQDSFPKNCSVDCIKNCTSFRINDYETLYDNKTDNISFTLVDHTQHNDHRRK